ncbi:cysteine--tRNA ligase [Candidatus Pacearchaeota archaeon]|nr:cysteine--tRNA ligase [Candidatus Pacearchaeota archaeon]
MLKLYNTLTRKKEEFKPIKKGKVGMYVCGPTVNDVPHLGHARQQISFDILRRYLKFLKYKVNFVSNITDIEDKIINKAHELKISVKELSKKNEKEHFEDYKILGIKKPDIQPKATEYVKEMIELVKKLEKKGYAYVIEGDGVYYDISKFKDYGKLSHQDIKNLKAGLRVKIKDEKRNKEDFVLWKFSKSKEPSWKSPWGAGRPGWHIECSAMSQKILGLPLDIHGGGQDLIFPHHEDEIAQSEAAFGKKFVNYWVHNGMVNIDKIKMSKSLGNFKTIKEVLKEYPGEVIRYFVISVQYRKPIDFSKKSMNKSLTAYKRLKNIISEIKDKGINKKYLKDFEEAMNDDLNTPRALQVLWKLLRDKKAKGKLGTIKKIDEVLGLNLLKKEKLEISKKVEKLIRERSNARKKNDWRKADEIRAKVKKLGYTIDDTGKGSVVKKI